MSKIVTLSIFAKDYYSRNSLKVNRGKTYIFKVAPRQKWVDLLIPSSVEGFNNIFLTERKKRLNGTKCFALCGTIGKNEKDHFYIGNYLEWKCPKDGQLFFFANDHINSFFYLGNFGSINLVIQKIDE